jgi:hypothetical protein
MLCLWQTLSALAQSGGSMWRYQIVSSTPPDEPAALTLEDSAALTAAAAPLIEALNAVSQRADLPAKGVLVQIRFLDIEGFGQEQRLDWPDRRNALVLVRPRGSDGLELIVDLSVSRLLGDLQAARNGADTLPVEDLWAPSPSCMGKMLSTFRSIVSNASSTVGPAELLPATACMPRQYQERYASILATTPRAFRGGMRQTFDAHIRTLLRRGCPGTPGPVRDNFRQSY